jgi:hypothetical protein
VKTVHHTATLVYYDGAQVFEARDRIGGHYVAVMVEPRDGLDRYVVVGADPGKLSQFRRGGLDLRSLPLETGGEEWYIATPKGGVDDPIELEQQADPLSESEYLPESGFFLCVEES